MEEFSKRNWELREQLYQLFHRWQVICGAIVLGALIGWLLSLIWPMSYRASNQLYLGFNGYRRYSDTIFEALSNPKYSNLDNYQYWQMSQLEFAIFMDRFLNPTLEKLRDKDEYWQTVDIEALRSMLASEWRTTGTWSLIANHTNPTFASQAAEAWSETALEHILRAVTASRNVIMIDHQLRVGEEALTQARLRRQELSLTIAAVDDWSTVSSKKDINSSPTPESRWRLFALISSPADFSPAWVALLEREPLENASIQEYLRWIKDAKTLISIEIQELDQTIRELDRSLTEQSYQYALESKASLSFSPNIEIEKMGESSVRVVRPTSTFIIIGSFIAIIIWLLYQLSLISKKGRNL